MPPRRRHCTVNERYPLFVDVQLAGRWASAQSCKLYIKRAEVALTRFTHTIPSHDWHKLEAIADIGERVFDVLPRLNSLGWGACLLLLSFGEKGSGQLRLLCVAECTAAYPYVSRMSSSANPCSIHIPA